MMEPTTQLLITQLTAAFTAIPYNRMLGLQLDQLDAEYVVMSFKMKEELIGNYHYGILHGGVISSVLDMAGGMLVMSAALHRMSEKQPAELATILSKTSTVDLQVSYLRPGQGEQFTAKAWLLKAGNKIAFTRMELHNQLDVLIATANGTYLLN